MILILIFAEVLGESLVLMKHYTLLANHCSRLGLYGLIVALLMNSRSKASC